MSVTGDYLAWPNNILQSCRSSAVVRGLTCSWIQIKVHSLPVPLAHTLVPRPISAIKSHSIHRLYDYDGIE